MADAVNMIRENKGGIAVVSGEDDFKDILELPIAGLMSDRDLEYVSYKLTELQQEAHHLGMHIDFSIYDTFIHGTAGYSKF